MRNFYTKIKKRIAPFLLVVVLFFTTLNINTATAIPVVEIGGNLGTNIMTTVQQTISSILDYVEKPMTIVDEIWKLANKYGLGIMKQGAIILSNKIVQKIVGGNGSGNPQFVQDWGAYLYIGPQQKANVYINSFFNQTTRGRLSTATGGVGSNYDSYMVRQAESAINGSPCVVNIQNYTSNPNQMFVDGNMRGFMSFLQPCNNPYTYSVIAQNAHQNKAAQEKEKAKSQVSNGGWLPKVNADGSISVPANLFSSALEGADQMGNQMIVNARDMKELGTAMMFRTGASLLKYQFGASAKKLDPYANTALVGASFLDKATAPKQQ